MRYVLMPEQHAKNRQKIQVGGPEISHQPIISHHAAHNNLLAG
jgi:hypothetical protein